MAYMRGYLKQNNFCQNKYQKVYLKYHNDRDGWQVFLDRNMDTYIGHVPLKYDYHIWTENEFLNYVKENKYNLMFKTSDKSNCEVSKFCIDTDVSYRMAIDCYTIFDKVTTEQVKKELDDYKKDVNDYTTYLTDEISKINNKVNEAKEENIKLKAELDYYKILHYGESRTCDGYFDLYNELKEENIKLKESLSKLVDDALGVPTFQKIKELESEVHRYKVLFEGELKNVKSLVDENKDLKDKNKQLIEDRNYWYYDKQKCTNNLIEISRDVAREMKTLQYEITELKEKNWELTQQLNTQASEIHNHYNEIINEKIVKIVHLNQKSEEYYEKYCEALKEIQKLRNKKD